MLETTLTAMRPTTSARYLRMAELRAQGLKLAEIGRLLGVTSQCVQQALDPKRRHPRFRVRCRVCDCDINPAGAVPRDDRQVYCLDCLANDPDAGFGEHLQAYRLAAGLKVVALAERSGVAAPQISSYEQGRTGSPGWKIMNQLFQALGVALVMQPDRRRHEPEQVPGTNGQHHDLWQTSCGTLVEAS
jgi:hypothetical protein